MKHYVGNARDQSVIIRERDAERPLQRVSTVLWKRPNGLHAWGYGGGGPHDLAYDLLLDVTGDREIAQVHHDDFCMEQIAGLPTERDFLLTDEAIKAWLRPRATAGDW